MAKHMIDDIEIETSSGNVFADLGLPDAEKLKIKSGLVIEIRKAIRNLGLTQQAAAKRIGATGRTRLSRLRQPVRTQTNGVPEPPRVRHRN